MKYNWRLNIDDIKNLYEKGYSCSDIGKMLGASRQAIWEKMKNFGLKARPKKLLPFVIYDDKKWTVSKTTGYYRQTNSRKTHVSLHRYVYEKESGKKIPAGYDIHHIDGNKTNNRFQNLECLPKDEHTKKYSPHHNQYKNNKTKHLYK